MMFNRKINLGEQEHNLTIHRDIQQDLENIQFYAK